MQEQEFQAIINEFLPLQEEPLTKMWRAFLAFQEQANNLNLTGLKTEKERAIKLFADSLGSLKFFDYSEIKTVADLGTGGGFPGVPMACVFPDITFTLIDATQKKVNAVSEILKKAAISNATTLWARSEDMAKEGKQFEVVVTKALADFIPMLEFSLPLVAPKGSLVAYVGPNELPSGPETKAVLEAFNAEFVSAHTYELPEGMGERQLFVIRKA